MHCCFDPTSFLPKCATENEKKETGDVFKKQQIGLFVQTGNSGKTTKTADFTDLHKNSQSPQNCVHPHDRSFERHNRRTGNEVIA